MEPKVTLTLRDGDYHACLYGQPGHWEADTAACYALAALVRSHPDAFGVKPADARARNPLHLLSKALPFLIEFKVAQPKE